MKKDYSQSAEKLVIALGGKSNVTRMFHCMTRLRFYVKNRKLINEADIKKLPEISGVNWYQDQFQVIAGNEVNELYDALTQKGLPTGEGAAAPVSNANKSIGSRIVDSITGCMTPMIPAGTRTLAINPLNWKTDSTPASREENAGACFTDYSGSIVTEIPHLTGAYIDPQRGALKVPDVSPQEYPPVLSIFSDGIYHLYDYQFFYRNLQENVGVRIDAYLSR